MTFEESLAAWLKLWAVSAHTYPDGEREIHPLTLPETTKFPAVCYDWTDPEETEDNEGFTRLIRADFDFDCWARTQPEALQLAREITAGLRSQKTRPRTPLVDGGPTVHGLNNLKPGIPDYSPKDTAYVVTVGVTIWHEEST